MHVTNVLSSHYNASFNQALLDAFVEGLEAAGHTYQNIDLYGMKFDPVMNGDDFNQFFGKPLPEEIVGFQDMLRNSDVVSFIYPVWWNDMPAVMKGWIDRVFAKDFAYQITDNGTIGCLPFKKAVLICTLGNKPEELHPSLEDAMRNKEAHGVFGYGGVDQVDHHFLYDVYNKELCAQYVEKVRELGKNLEVG